MNIYRLGLACTLPLFAACNANNSPIKITSETVSQQQLDTIVVNIEKRYPEATQEQKQNAAEVVVRAIENLVFVEGGSFDLYRYFGLVTVITVISRFLLCTRTNLITTGKQSGQSTSLHFHVLTSKLDKQLT
ncbi:hypothetical protein [Photobacterium galatheae]|uniref:hypothetical protein n=1 Tax=Photobacterium galatheae TaxID=1654360 RepID=UPI0026A658BB